MTSTIEIVLNLESFRAQQQQSFFCKLLQPYDFSKKYSSCCQPNKLFVPKLSNHFLSVKLHFSPIALSLYPLLELSVFMEKSVCNYHQSKGKQIKLGKIMACFCTSVCLCVYVGVCGR